MATSEQDITSDSLDDTVTEVPESLLDYVISNIVDFLIEAKIFRKISAKIHHAEGQLPKLVVTYGDKSAKQLVAASRDNGGLKRTRTIVVKNVPASADEELLEVFFESTKKQGGGPVQNVKMYRDKNVAFVEFCDCASVERVLLKRPIKLGTTELDVQSYKPLLQGSEKLNRMDFLGLPAAFTDGLLKEQLDSLLSPQARYPTISPGPKPKSLKPYVNRKPPPARSPAPNPGPQYDLPPAKPPHTSYDEHGALIKQGSQVIRGKDWNYENWDGSDVGTVQGFNIFGDVEVRWKNGNEGWYSLGGRSGHYDIKLAPIKRSLYNVLFGR